MLSETEAIGEVEVDASNPDVCRARALIALSADLIDIRLTGRGLSVAMRRYCFDSNTDGTVPLASCDIC